jgi:hypothetical protein
MPTVLREKGYAFYFYPGEGNEPPHVHVEKGSGGLKLWLSDLSIASVGGMKPPEIREALKIARTHRKMLLNAWNDFKGRQG